MDGGEGDFDLIGQFLLYDALDPEIAAGLQALSKNGKARELFSDLGRREIFVEGDDVDSSGEAEEDEDQEKSHEEELTEASGTAGIKKAEQSREITLKMLRDQDRKERRKLMNVMGEKLPKGVKLLLTEDNFPMPKKTIQITEQMKCPTSNPSDPILKFSEIFLAPVEKPVFLRRKKVIKLRREFSNYEFEADESDIFTRSTAKVPNQELVRQEFLEALKEAKQKKEEEFEEDIVEERKEEIVEEKVEHKMFGSYDEEKINQLFSCFDWEKDIVEIANGDRPTKRPKTAPQQLTLTDDEVVFKGKMKLTEDVPIENKAAPSTPTGSYQFGTPNSYSQWSFSIFSVPSKPSC
jgi:hypothetical protein